MKVKQCIVPRKELFVTLFFLSDIIGESFSRRLNTSVQNTVNASELKALSSVHPVTVHGFISRPLLPISSVFISSSASMGLAILVVPTGGRSKVSIRFG